ncbi:spermatogenesis-associated protein 13 isoform X2 [Synchiropus splendidus]|nr:spermatogenesis-associated protein 13 isoform X2 [Synchiropus splendidus]XP_053716290.1 spermatogenesis-associated protein 13 isoform X2 [Synchiropus splendidus]
MTSRAFADENHHNGINSSAWSNPVIMQAEGKTSRIMSLFSTSRKAPDPGQCSGADSPITVNVTDGSSVPQSWAGLPGLGVMDSFKKLRSTVLQGIQSRAVNCEEKHSSHQEATNTHSILDKTTNHSNGLENFSMSRGRLTSEIIQSDIDLEDYEDYDESDDDGLQRNSRFSRSIRRAYGAGRISLLDMENGRRTGSCQEKACDGQKLEQSSKECEQTESMGANATVLSRLSKSAENLHLFKAPFKRRAPSPGSPSPTADCDINPSNGTTSIHRTSSASSADLRGHSRRKGPVKPKGQMPKLVNSMTDLTVRRRQSPSPSPTTPSPMSPLCRLHDDYSRRVPCLTTSERQRRPSPVRARLMSVEHRPLVHTQPDVTQQQQEAAGPSSSAAAAAALSESLGLTSCGSEQTMQKDAAPYHKPQPSSQSQDQADNPQSCEVTPYQKGHEPLLQAELSQSSSSSTPPTSPVSPAESPASPSDASAESSVKPRRRNGRPRPRPISDYGQLSSRKQPIPEEVAVLHSEDRTAEVCLLKDCVDSDRCVSGGSPENGSINGNIHNRKQRPNSVMGVVDLLSADSEEKEGRLPSPLSRPPIPSHQVPPYKGVSARFRPSTLSQSTPIGLDRVGRRRLHRVLSDGVPECSGTLDDSVSEEEEGSFDELPDVTPYLEPGVELSVLIEGINSGHAVYAEALWDHVTMEEQELAFKVGDVVRVLDAPHKDWWWGRGAEREGWFPSSFVRVRVNQGDSSAGSVESVTDQEDPTPRDPHSSQHREQMRTNVVQEIMNTERIYIKHLKDICDGYIRQCRKHPDMFTEHQLNTIFSNIEDIYKFQRQFLRDLDKKYNKDQPHLSEIGACFLMQGEGFSIYSDYCNTHPAACAELQRLMKSGRYKHFFEACRLLQQMIDISIAGFLLTPVQKICKYPLQLGELLKYTPKDHSDYSGVSEAYNAMKNVASLINERKRRLESVDAIAHWQVAILHWEGSDVLDRSSELIHSGEMTRLVRQGKMQQRSFFLFDHQLVFCKKDVLRRDLLHYRGRLDMDQVEVLDLPDGRNTELGLMLRNAIRLRNASTLEFVCVLCCRKVQDKQRWLEAFAKERNRVKEDQEMGIEISEEQRKQALLNARKAKKGKMKAIGYSGSVPLQNLHPLHQRHVTIPTSVPQQQVFSLAEPPKRKPYNLLYSITRNALFRK